MLRSADQAVLRADEGALPRDVRGGGERADVEVEVEFSGGATTMNHNRALADALGGERGGVRHRRRGHGPGVGSTDMGNVSWVVPAIHPDLSIADGPTPGHSIEFRDAAARPRADRTVLLAATLVAQTAIDLLLDPALVEAAWREFRAEAIGRRVSDCGPGYDAARRAPLDGGPEPAAPRLRRRPRPAPATVDGRPPPEDNRGRASPAPGRRRLRGAQRLGPRVRDVRRLRPADLRRPADVHEAAVGPGPGRAPARATSTSRSSARRSTTRSATGRARGSGRGRSARRSTRAARSTRSSWATSRSRC